jgi:hypothetical protein
MSTNNSEQDTPADRQAINMVEFVAFIPHETPVELRHIDRIETVDTAEYAFDDEHSVDFETLDLDNIVNIDNSAFTDFQVLEIYQRLIQLFLAAQASLQQLTDDTALSIKELQHEIDAAKRGLEYREVMLARYSHGWRAKVQKVARNSRPDELRQGIEDHKSVIASMERIKRLVMDNEAARLPVMTEKVEVDLERVQAYDAYIEGRGLVLPSDAPGARVD